MYKTNGCVASRNNFLNLIDSGKVAFIKEDNYSQCDNESKEEYELNLINATITQNSPPRMLDEELME